LVFVIIQKVFKLCMCDKKTGSVKGCPSEAYLMKHLSPEKSFNVWLCAKQKHAYYPKKFNIQKFRKTYISHFVTFET